MAGTPVADTLDPVLMNAVDVDGTGAEAAVQVNSPHDVEIVLDVGKAAGTSPTAQIDIEASDDSTFTVGVVTVGTFIVA